MTRLPLPALRDRLRDPDESLNRRPVWVARIAFAALTLLMLGLLGRVVQLQVWPDAQVAALTDTQTSRMALMGRPGAILDRRNRPLAVTRVARRLFIDPQLIIDRNTFSERVGYSLDYDPVMIEKTLAARDHSRYIVIDARLSDERVDRLAEVDLPGLATEPVLVRDYPQGALAGQLVGFVGVDGHGLDGLELALNSRLAAAPGALRYLRDHRRNPLWVDAHGYTPHTDGYKVRLSIDLTLQAMAEQRLAAAVEQYNAEAGQMIIMDPTTGEVLAMANTPTFDPNRFQDADPQFRRNRCVTDAFEPGSIFKPLVWAALTDLGLARPTEKIDCTDAGYWRTPYRRTLRDARGIGTVDWDTVLIKSSNIGMAKVAHRTSLANLHRVVRAYGFGQTTGSQLPGEIDGLVQPLRAWTQYSQSSIPMGQEIAVTALQITRAFCVLANDGLLVTPTIEYVDRSDPHLALIQERVISSATAAHTRAVLRRVVTEGTGRKANSDRYALFGKSGTAQLPDFENGGYHQDRYVSSFIAGAPLDAPRLVTLCVLHDPDRSIGHYGGTVAAPAVRDVMEQALAYLGIPPSGDE